MSGLAEGCEVGSRKLTVAFDWEKLFNLSLDLDNQEESHKNSRGRMDREREEERRDYQRKRDV